MSNQDKREATTFSSSSSSSSSNSFPNTDNYNRGSAEENKQSLNRSLDETKRNIQKNLDEARGQITRYTQSISDAQEHAIQATKEIADSYIEYQKQALNSFQSIFTPYIENMNNNVWNNQDYIGKKLPEMYSKVVSNYAENT